MNPKDALIIAVIILVVILIISVGSWTRSGYRKCHACGHRAGGCGRYCRCRVCKPEKSNFCTSSPDLKSGHGDIAPWVAPHVQQAAIDRVKGHPDAEHILNMQHEKRLKGETVSPEEIMLAERELHQSATESRSGAPHNTETMTEVGDDLMQNYATAPAINYQEISTDIIADDRMKENQYKWAHAMKGYGATTLKADDLHPEDYLPHHGLRFPQAGVGQCNPLQITEIDDTHLARNAKFNFKG